MPTKAQARLEEISTCVADYMKGAHLMASRSVGHPDRSDFLLGEGRPQLQRRVDKDGVGEGEKRAACLGPVGEHEPASGAA